MKGPAVERCGHLPAVSQPLRKERGSVPSSEFCSGLPAPAGCWPSRHDSFLSTGSLPALCRTGFKVSPRISCPPSKSGDYGRCMCSPEGPWKPDGSGAGSSGGDTGPSLSTGCLFCSFLRIPGSINSHLPSGTGFRLLIDKRRFPGSIDLGFLRTERVSPCVWECEVTVCRRVASVFGTTGS